MLAFGLSDPIFERESFFTLGCAGIILHRGGSDHRGTGLVQILCTPYGRFRKFHDSYPRE